MKTKIIVAILAISVICGFTFAGNWNADALKSKIRFDVDGPFGTVHGKFSGLKASIRFNENDLAGSAITASVEAGTVSTGISLRNRDLRRKTQWFNAGKYPLIKFQSAKIQKAGKGYIATGILTMKGITRTIEMPFTFTNNSASGLFESKFSIKRMDYKLGNKGGSVGDVITIILSVPVNK